MNLKSISLRACKVLWRAIPKPGAYRHSSAELASLTWKVLLIGWAGSITLVVLMEYLVWASVGINALNPTEHHRVFTMDAFVATFGPVLSLMGKDETKIIFNPNAMSLVVIAGIVALVTLLAALLQALLRPLHSRIHVTDIGFPVCREMCFKERLKVAMLGASSILLVLCIVILFIVSISWLTLTLALLYISPYGKLQDKFFTTLVLSPIVVTALYYLIVGKRERLYGFACSAIYAAVPFFAMSYLFMYNMDARAPRIIFAASSLCGAQIKDVCVLSVKLENLEKFEMPEKIRLHWTYKDGVKQDPKNSYPTEIMLRARGVVAPLLPLTLHEGVKQYAQISISKDECKKVARLPNTPAESIAIEKISVAMVGNSERFFGLETQKYVPGDISQPFLLLLQGIQSICET